MSEIDEIENETLTYLKEVSGALFDPSSTRKVTGQLAPYAEQYVGMYGSNEASGSLTTASGTTSVMVYYDPMATQAMGQNSVHIIERNSASVVTNIQTISVGLSSDKWDAAGVLSSSLTVSNVGSDTARQGTSRVGVIIAPQTSIFSKGMNEITNDIMDQEMDFAVASDPRVPMTTRLLGKSALSGDALQTMQKNAVSHDVAQRHQSAGFNATDILNSGAVRTFDGLFINDLDDSDSPELAFSSTSDGASPYNTDVSLYGLAKRTAAQLVSNKDKHNVYYDSRTAKDSSGKLCVFGADVYECTVVTQFSYKEGDSASTEDVSGVSIFMGGFSEDGALVTDVAITRARRDIAGISGTVQKDLAIANGVLTSSTAPISYVLISVSDLDTDDKFFGHSTTVSQFSETSTAKMRRVHFALFDSLDASGNEAISVSASCVTAGLLNKEGRQTSRPVKFHSHMISDDLLKSYVRFIDSQLIRAYPQSDHIEVMRFLKESLQKLSDSPDVRNATDILEAKSFFGGLGKGISKVGKLLKSGAKVTDAVKQGAAIADSFGVPGAGAVAKMADYSGDAMRMGSRLSNLNNMSQRDLVALAQQLLRSQGNR